MKTKTKNTRPALSADTRAYLSKLGKSGMEKRWGSPRPPTASIRIWKDVAKRLKVIPVQTRVAWVSRTIEAALGKADGQK